MKLKIGFIFLSLSALAFLLPAHARRSIVERKLYSMNSTQLVRKAPLIQEDSRMSNFSGSMRIRGLWSAQRDNQIPVLSARFKGGWTGMVSAQTGWGFRFASTGLATHKYLDQSDSLLGGKAIVALDTAYISYQINSSLKFQLGEMDNPYLNDTLYNLMWDEDITPGGVHISYQKRFSKRYQMRWQASGLIFGSYLETTFERPEASQSSSLIQNYMGATSASIQMDYENFELNGGIGFYGLRDVPSTDPKSILDIVLQMSVKNFWIPFSASVQLLQNFETESENFGVVAGAIINDTSRSFKLGYHWLQLSKDVTISSLADSDALIGLDTHAFQGVRGHRFTVDYFFNPSFSVGAKYTVSSSPPGADPLNHSIFGSVNLRI